MCIWTIFLYLTIFYIYVVSGEIWHFYFIITLGDLPPRVSFRSPIQLGPQGLSGRSKSEKEEGDIVAMAIQALCCAKYRPLGPTMPLLLHKSVGENAYRANWGLEKHEHVLKNLEHVSFANWAKNMHLS